MNLLLIRWSNVWQQLMFFKCLNNLESNGINVTTKYEDNFPARLVKQLKRDHHYIYFIVAILILLKMVFH